MILSVDSVLPDTTNEMLYPIVSNYLKTIGFSIVISGILEGVAEATTGLSKGYFGKLSYISGEQTLNEHKHRGNKNI